MINWRSILTTLWCINNRARITHRQTAICRNAPSTCRVAPLKIMILTATCCRPLFQFAVMPFSPKRTETTFFCTKLITASIHKRIRAVSVHFQTFSVITADSTRACSHRSEWDFFFVNTLPFYYPNSLPRTFVRIAYVLYVPEYNFRGVNAMGEFS